MMNLTPATEGAIPDLLAYWLAAICLGLAGMLIGLSLLQWKEEIGSKILAGAIVFLVPVTALGAIALAIGIIFYGVR